MSVQVVNQPKVTQQKKLKAPIIVGSAIAGGLATGALTYFLAPDKVDGNSLYKLSDDKFEKVFKNVPENQKGDVEYLTDLRRIKAKAPSDIDKFLSLLMEDSKEISKDKFIEKTFKGEYKSVEEYQKALKQAKIDAPVIKERYESVKKACENINTNSKAEKELSEAKAILWKNYNLTSQEGRIDEIFKLAKNDVLSIESLKSHGLKNMSIDLMTDATEALEVFDKGILKVKSFKKASIYGGVAAVIIAGLSALLTGTKKEAKQVAPKA